MLGLRWVRIFLERESRARPRRREGGQGDRSFYPLGGFLVVDGGSSDQAELHSALHNAGARADIREPIGRWVGYGFGRFWFGANAGGAFGGCVRLGIGISREAAKARRGPRGKADFDRIYMMDRI